jgi:rubredoxin
MIFGKMECDRCGEFFDPGDMTKSQKETETGRSGNAVTIHQGKSGMSYSLSSGRRFYKIRDVYLCPECETVRLNSINRFGIMDVIGYLFTAWVLFVTYKVFMYYWNL